MACVDGRGGPGGLAPPAGGYRGPGPLVLHSTKACALFVVLSVGKFVRVCSSAPRARSRLWLRVKRNGRLFLCGPAVTAQKVCEFFLDC